MRSKPSIGIGNGLEGGGEEEADLASVSEKKSGIDIFLVCTMAT